MKKWASFSVIVGLVSLSSAGESPVARQQTKATDLLQRPVPLVIGHRGAAAKAPENTLPSFQLALEAGADLVELDYHLLAGGEPVVIHDTTLDRTTDAVSHWGGEKIRVEGANLEALRRLDAGKWFDTRFAGTRVPTLELALECILSSSVPLVERKSGDAASLIALLRNRGVVERVVVQAFDWEFLKECHRLDPRLTLGALGPPSQWHGRQLKDEEKRLCSEFIEAAISAGAGVVGWNRQVDAQSIALAHRHGIAVWVYTINDPAEAQRLTAMGIDGIITDDPGLIRKHFATASMDGAP